MDTSDVKDMAQNAKSKLQDLVSDDSPLERVRGAAEQVDGTVRSFAKEQPVVALIVALTAGYLVGRAVAKIT